jgi:HEAT repeat protein
MEQQFNPPEVFAERKQPVVPPLLVLDTSTPIPSVPEQTNSLTREINHQLSHMGHESPQREMGMMVYWISFPLLLAFCLGGLNAGEPGTFLTSASLLILFTLLKSLSTNLDRTKAALCLMTADKRWIGPLAMALEWPNKRIRQIAAVKLQHLLPLLTAEDANLLDAKQRSYLYKQLRIGGNSELNVAILHALVTIGDTEAIPAIQPHLKRWPRTLGQWHVRQSASACLPLLESLKESRHAAGKPRTAVSAPALVSEETAESSLTDEEVPPEIQVVNAHVEAQLSELQALIVKNNPGMRQGYLIASWLTIVPYTALMAVNTFMQGDWLAGAFFGGSCIGATQLHRLTLSWKHTDAAKRLAHYDDVRGIGPLIEALEWPDSEMQHIAARSLTDLLTRVRASDYGLLNARQRSVLYRTLNMSRARTFPKLLISILKALEQIGDAEAVPYVERLAHGFALLDSQREVRVAAQDCLPFLRDRARLTSQSQTLLRASHVSETHNDALLRPVQSTQTADPDQLLRPGAREE